jgi:hypothetical protein
MIAKKLSLITHHYNSHDKSKELVAHISQLDPQFRNEFELLIVDDFSDDCVELDHGGLALRHYRILDDIPWNQAGSRNLGAMLARGEWALFFDIDQKISLSGLEYVLTHCKNLDPTTMYYFLVDNFVDSNTNETLTVHPNTFLVNTHVFHEIGMYDEDFAGNYGYEDLYLPYQWERHGGKRAIIGETAFFTDQKFKTANLTRDLEVNKLKGHYKMQTGIKRPKDFIRFQWALIRNQPASSIHP